MDWAPVGLPGTILAVKFLLRLFVDRSASSVEIIQAMLAFPVDILFLALSLVAGYALATPNTSQSGLVFFAATIAIGIIVVVLWRRADALFIRNRHWAMAAIAFVNFAICSAVLVKAVTLFTAGSAAR